LYYLFKPTRAAAPLRSPAVLGEGKLRRALSGGEGGSFQSVSIRLLRERRGALYELFKPRLSELYNRHRD
jgi:hypothetical protein